MLFLPFHDRSWSFGSRLGALARAARRALVWTPWCRREELILPSVCIFCMTHVFFAHGFVLVVLATVARPACTQAPGEAARGSIWLVFSVTVLQCYSS